MNQIKQGYKQTKVGIIPKDWEVVKIKEATSYVDYRGKTPTKTDKGMFLVTAKNIKQGFIDYQASSEFVSEVEYHEIMRRGMPKIGDILITTEAPLGNVAQIDKENIALAQRVIKFRNKSNVKNDFLKHYFLSNIFQSYLYRMAIGTTVLGIQGKELHNMFIPLPPLKEQEKIAEILTTWDEAISKQTELIKEKELLKKALMQKLLSGEVRFSGFSDEWHFYKLGDLLDYEQPTNYLVNDTNYDNSFDTPVLTAGKTFILGYTNETAGIYKEQLPVIIFDDFTTATQFVNFPFKAKSSAMKILKSKGNLSNIKVVFELMQTIKYQADDHKRYWISEYQDLEIKLPSLLEQQKIAEVLSLIDAEINLLKNELKELKLQKKALMQKLLTGEVRVGRFYYE